MPPSPLCLVSDNGGPFNPTANGLNVNPGDPIAIVLDSPAGITNWYLQVGLTIGAPPVVVPGTGTDELQVSPPTLVGTNGAGLVTGGPASTVTITAFPAAGSALLISSTITGGFGQITTTFALFALTTGGYRVGAAGMSREGSTAYGWVPITNAAIRHIGSGSGVVSVTASAPLVSSGGMNPDISLAPVGETLGDILYFNGTAWTRLPAGGSGQFLATGPSSNPNWGTPPLPTDLNITGEQAGDLLYFNGSNWVRFAKGSAGQFLAAGTTGPMFTPSWETITPGINEQYNGTPVTGSPFSTQNFTGSGVSVTNVGGIATINIPGTSVGPAVPDAASTNASPVAIGMGTDPGTIVTSVTVTPEFTGKLVVTGFVVAETTVPNGDTAYLIISHGASPVSGDFFGDGVTVAGSTGNESQLAILIQYGTTFDVSLPAFTIGTPVQINLAVGSAAGNITIPTEGAQINVREIGMSTLIGGPLSGDVVGAENSTVVQAIQGIPTPLGGGATVGDALVVGAGPALVYTPVVISPAGGMPGDLLYLSSTGWARVPKGTTGQFLETGSTGPDFTPSWATAVAGINEQYNGSPVTGSPFTTQNFTGSGVSVTNVGGIATINIPGGGGGGPAVPDAASTNASPVSIGIGTNPGTIVTSVTVTPEYTGKLVVTGFVVAETTVPNGDTAYLVISHGASPVSGDFFGEGVTIPGPSGTEGQLAILIQYGTTFDVSLPAFTVGTPVQINLAVGSSAGDITIPTEGAQLNVREIGMASGVGGVAVDNQGSPIAGNPHTTFNFTGAGVAASDAGGGVATINIPGGGSGVTVESGGSPIANNPHSTLNFTTGLASVDAGGGVATVTAAAGGGVLGNTTYLSGHLAYGSTQTFDGSPAYTPLTSGWLQIVVQSTWDGFGAVSPPTAGSTVIFSIRINGSGGFAQTYGTCGLSPDFYVSGFCSILLNCAAGVPITIGAALATTLGTVEGGFQITVMELQTH